MSLTTSQLAALKAAILADATLNALPPTLDSGYEIAIQLDVLAVPAYIVWRTSVPVDDIMRNGMDWARVDNLSVGKARIWDWMTRLGTFNAAKANIRAGIDAAWVGTAADLAVRATVYTHCKRNATRAEKVLKDSGSGTDVDPAVMGVEGKLVPQDVYEARNS